MRESEESNKKKTRSSEWLHDPGKMECVVVMRQKILDLDQFLGSALNCVVTSWVQWLRVAALDQQWC